MPLDLRQRAKRLGFSVRPERGQYRVRGVLLDGRSFSVRTTETGVLRIIEAFEQVPRA